MTSIFQQARAFLMSLTKYEQHLKLQAEKQHSFGLICSSIVHRAIDKRKVLSRSYLSVRTMIGIEIWQIVEYNAFSVLQYLGSKVFKAYQVFHG